MFKLTETEWEEIICNLQISSMRSQIVIASHSNKLISPEGLIRVLPKCL